MIVLIPVHSGIVGEVSGFENMEDLAKYVKAEFPDGLSMNEDVFVAELDMSAPTLPHEYAWGVWNHDAQEWEI